jgi:hypothetical protein
MRRPINKQAAMGMSYGPGEKRYRGPPVREKTLEERLAAQAVKEAKKARRRKARKKRKARNDRRKVRRAAKHSK